MNGSRAVNAELLQGILAGLDADAGAGTQASCAVCVPAPYLFQCEQLLAGSSVAWGAQDVATEPCGAFTGEVCVSMLHDFGCRYVIVGHSERRAMFGDTDEVVAQKIRAALLAGLVPILCVGETLAEREAGQTESVIARQLDAVLALNPVSGLQSLVIAYEPVWAIGTGKTATPAMAQEVHASLRAKLRNCNAEAAENVQILYGGSMKPENARELLAQPDIDGGLIGGAALKAVDFLAILRAA